MSAVLEPPVETIDKHLEELDTVTIRFAGDSGDGMQLTGTQFTNTSAIVGNDISTLNRNALKGNVQLSRKEIDRSKNFFALGVLYWLYDRPLDPTLNWINAKFKKNPELVKANEVALKTGYNFAETTEVFTTHYKVKKAVIAPGRYRKITGNEATAIGFVAG